MRKEFLFFERPKLEKEKSTESVELTSPLEQKKSQKEILEGIELFKDLLEEYKKRVKYHQPRYEVEKQKDFLHAKLTQEIISFLWKKNKKEAERFWKEVKDILKIEDFEKFKSGILSHLALMKFFKEAGYEVFLPPVEWDVKRGIDFVAKKKANGKEVYFLFQVKGLSSSFARSYREQKDFVFSIKNLPKKTEFFRKVVEKVYDKFKKAFNKIKSEYKLPCEEGFVVVLPFSEELPPNGEIELERMKNFLEKGGLRMME